MNVGLIAHNSKKKLMQDFCIAYKGILGRNNLYATATTGRFIEDVTKLNIRKFLPGLIGGEQQLASQIANNDMDMVIFLRDPGESSEHEPDVNRIIRLCDLYNIPIATNIASAELLVLALGNGDLEWREN